MTPAARTPLLVVADDDPDERALIESELQRRYGADYTIRICTTGELGNVLDQAETDGDDIALALACWDGRSRPARPHARPLPDGAARPPDPVARLEPPRHRRPRAPQHGPRLDRPLRDRTDAAPR